MSLEDDLFTVGESIENLINNVISSQDFQHLNQKLSDTIHSYTNQPSQAGSRHADPGSDPLRNSYTRRVQNTINQPIFRASRQAIERQRFNNVNDKAFKSTIQRITGGALAGLFGIGTIALIPDLFVTGEFGVTLAAVALCGGLTALGVNLVRKGIKTAKRVDLFKKIKNVIGTKEYIDTNELAYRVNLEKNKLITELNAMLAEGYFRMGHLDREGSCLMVTDQVYGQYRELEKHQQELKAEAAREAERQLQEEMESGVTAEYRQMMEACEDYIAKIHQCNIDLPEENITRKLNRLEAVVTRIVEEARQNPKKTSELHKFMNYYMPTTWKLLDAYRTFDREPIQSENIVNTKREIEQSLDTINEAYEKLLNDLFQATAWDISADISVLNAMLAQEGLTDSDFEKLKEQEAAPGQTMASGGTMLHF